MTEQRRESPVLECPHGHRSYCGPCEANIDANAKQLVESIEWLIAIVEHEAPEPSHEGSCHPDAGCDGGCADLYYYAVGLQKARDALARLKNAMPSSSPATEPK